MAPMLAMISLMVGGCGLGPFASEAGGSDNLPIAGTGPYAKLDADADTPADEPVVLADRDANLLAPSVVERDDGGFVIFYERREVGGGFGRIFAAEISSLSELPGRAPRTILAPTLGWQGDDLRNPAIVRVDDDTLHLYYDAGTPAAIGRAISTDGGETFVAEPDPLVENAQAPSAVIFESETLLVFEGTLRVGIFAAIESASGEFVRRSSPVLVPLPEPTRFDRASVGAPFLLASRTIAGQPHFDLFYEGRTGEVEDDGDVVAGIGHAGGFRLDALERAFEPVDPIVQEGAPYESSPSVIPGPRRAIMFFAQRSNIRFEIAAAATE